LGGRTTTYGIISDIHGNIEALEAVLAELQDVDAIICCGDIVGYGANPNDCCDLIRGLGVCCVAGNHDLASTIDLDVTWFNSEARRVAMWTAENLSRANFDYVASLKTRIVIDDFEIMHGTPEDVSYYVFTARDAGAAFERMSARLGFCGHTHIAAYFRRSLGSRFASGKAASIGRVVTWGDNESLLVNPGSVGQPRDGDPRASYALYVPEERRIEIRRVSYNVPKAQAKIRAAGLPTYFAERLALGR
jgi:predicted phosphodiesterase